VLADHANARAALDEVAVGVDLAVAHHNALHSAEAQVSDRTGFGKGCIGRPLAVRRRYMLMTRATSEDEPDEQGRRHEPTRRATHWNRPNPAPGLSISLIHAHQTCSPRISPGKAPMVTREFDHLDLPATPSNEILINLGITGESGCTISRLWRG